MLAGSRVTKLVLCCTSSGGAGGASYPLHELYEHGEPPTTFSGCTTSVRSMTGPSPSKCLPSSRIDSGPTRRHRTPQATRGAAPPQHVGSAPADPGPDAHRPRHLRRHRSTREQPGSGRSDLEGQTGSLHRWSFVSRPRRRGLAHYRQIPAHLSDGNAGLRWSDDDEPAVSHVLVGERFGWGGGGVVRRRLWRVGTRRLPAASRHRPRRLCRARRG